MFVISVDIYFECWCYSLKPLTMKATRFVLIFAALVQTVRPEGTYKQLFIYSLFTLKTGIVPASVSNFNTRRQICLIMFVLSSDIASISRNAFCWLGLVKLIHSATTSLFVIQSEFLKCLVGHSSCEKSPEAL